MKAPLLPAELDEREPPALEDDCEWESLAVRSDLSDRTASTVDIARCRFTGVSFIGTALDGVRIIDSVFERCDLSGAVFGEAFLERVEIRGCRLSGFVVAGGRLRDVRVVESRGEEANFRMATGERVWFEDCQLPAADFYGARISDARWTRCDLGGAAFSKAQISGARLHGSNLRELTGADGLRGVVIGSDQVVPLAWSLLTASGVLVDDDALP